MFEIMKNICKFSSFFKWYTIYIFHFFLITQFSPSKMRCFIFKFFLSNFIKKWVDINRKVKKKYILRKIFFITKLSYVTKRLQSAFGYSVIHICKLFFVEFLKQLLVLLKRSPTWHFSYLQLVCVQRIFVSRKS